MQVALKWTYLEESPDLKTYALRICKIRLSILRWSINQGFHDMAASVRRALRSLRMLLSDMNENVDADYGLASGVRVLMISALQTVSLSYSTAYRKS